MADKKESLAWKFTKFATRTLAVGGLTFAFGIAVGGLIDYQLFHEMVEMQPVIAQTSWIQDWLRADTIFGGSVVDGIVALGDLIGETPEPPPATEFKTSLQNAEPENPESSFSFGPKES